MLFSALITLMLGVFNGFAVGWMIHSYQEERKWWKLPLAGANLIAGLALLAISFQIL